MMILAGDVDKIFVPFSSFSQSQTIVKVSSASDTLIAVFRVPTLVGLLLSKKEPN